MHELVPLSTCSCGHDVKFLCMSSWYDHEVNSFNATLFVGHENTKTHARLLIFLSHFKLGCGLRADTLNLVYRWTISTLYAIRGPAAPQANLGAVPKDSTPVKFTYSFAVLSYLE